MDPHPKLWMTVQEAAEYLSCSEESVERRLVKWPSKCAGCVRFRRIEDWNARSKSERQRATPVRLLGEDVYALLPLPEERLGVQRSEFDVERSTLTEL